MAHFYGWGSNASRLEPLRGGSLLFITKFPESPGTHFIDLGRMKGWVDLGATQWFWTQNPWIGNLTPWSCIAQEKHVWNYLNTTNYSVTQLTVEPTRTSKCNKILIDHILLNSPDKKIQSGVTEMGLSDHKLMFCSRKTSCLKLSKCYKLLNYWNFCGKT